MAVSPIMKAFQIFSVLGAVSITPLAHSFFKEKGEIKLPEGSKRQMPEDHRKELEPENQEITENAMKEAVQRMELEGGQEGQTGCFWLFERNRSFEFFMCVDTKTLSPLTLFHYARKERSMPLKDKLNEVSEITYNGTTSLLMTLKSGTTKNMPNHLRTSFAWLRKGSSNFIPSRHCSLTLKDSSKNYTLDCSFEGNKGFSEIVNPEPPYKKVK